MHSNIRYQEGDEEDRRALNDFVNYLGLSRAKILRRLAMDITISEESYTHWCSFAGVEGRPVHVSFKRWRGQTKAIPMDPTKTLESVASNVQ